MILNFDAMETTTIPHMYGGEKEMCAKMLNDGQCKILRGCLAPGASIGTHTHVDSSEILFVVSGTGTAVYDGVEETVHTGECHYCPKGHSHSFANKTDEDVVIYAVIPQQ